MAKRSEKKGGLEPLIPPPADSSREKIRGNSDDAARFLRERGQTNRTGGPVNRLLPGEVEAEPWEGLVDQESPTPADDDTSGPAELTPRLKELIELCSKIGYDDDASGAVIPEGLPGSERRKPPPQVAALVQGLLWEIPRLKNLAADLRTIIRCRLINGMPKGEIAEVLGYNFKLLNIDVYIKDAIAQFRSGITKIDDLAAVVGRLFDLAGDQPSGFYRLPPADEHPQLPDGPDAKRPDYLAALLATVPDSEKYEDYAGRLEGLTHDVKLQVAAHLQPKLNAEAHAMPHGTYEQKKTLAKWVNDELRRFDLAIKCPKTGQPSILLVGSGNHPEIGRFMIEHKTPEGKRVRPVSTPELPQLELMEANPRREALLEWRDRVGDQRGGTSSPPADYERQAEGLAAAVHAERQELAAQLAPALNAKIRAMPHDDLDGKKKVCDFVNSELERFGLAVQCPKTGLPAKLKGNPGNWPEIGRFAFEVYVDGKRERSAYSDKLPELQLIDANPANELESGWQAKVGPKASRPGRKLAD